MYCYLFSHAGLNFAIYLSYYYAKLHPPAALAIDAEILFLPNFNTAICFAYTTLYFTLAKKDCSKKRGALKGATPKSFKILAQKKRYAKRNVFLFLE
jgi:hypothetical protein